MRNKLLKLFDVYYSEGTTLKAILADLDKRGKLDIKKVWQTIELLISDVEEIHKQLELTNLKFEDLETKKVAKETKKS